MITLIAAAAENNALGKDNEMIWHLPDDFKRFKKLTSHHYIIMGRKTLESFPTPLPNRTHIVITRQENYEPKFEGVLVAKNLEEALKLAEEQEQIWIIGGGEIYKLALDQATHIELTRVHGTFEADAYFPEIDPETWELISSQFHDKDERHDYAFTYLTYVKRKS